jgi:hypothetical protein
VTPIEIAGLVKDFGSVGIAAILAVVVRFLFLSARADTKEAAAQQLADAKAYAAQLEKLVQAMAVAIERSAATNAAVSAALESRTGIFERLSEAVEEARAETRALITDLKSHSVTNDAWTRDKLDTASARIQAILDRIDELRREVGR